LFDSQLEDGIIMTMRGNQFPRQRTSVSASIRGVHRRLLPPGWTAAVAWLLLAACGGGVCIATRQATAAGPPNVVLIMTDDQGYGELSCHGNPVVRTPHLDTIARESVRLTDFNVDPMCTPTRGQQLTGVDCLRNGAMNVSSGRTLLRREYPTMANVLKAAGYATGQFGKWHLGDNYPFRPHDRGFDECVWYPSSHIGSTPDFWENDYFDDMYYHRGERQRYEGYTTDVFFREAMNWIKSQRRSGPDKPLFVYLATAAAHGPLYVPEKYRDAVRPRLKAALGQLPPLTTAQQEQVVRYLAMVENIDENIGRLEGFLAEEQMRDNTILIFLTDNGSTWGPRYFNAGMKGGKVTLWEGGHRVPCFIRWPGGKLGTPRDEPALTQVQDILPTLADLCGVQPPQTDGTSLAPLLRAETTSLPDRTLVINYSRMPVPGHEDEVVPKEEGAAVLWKRWRLLEDRALYDLATDPLQERDVAEQHPEIVKKLRSHLAAWWDGVKGRVNEPERIIIGSDAEREPMLTACEWFDVFIDQQAQVRRGERKNGVWHLEVAKAGDYEIELRRWPREAKLALNAAAPPAKLTDGQLPAGTALSIARAALEIGGQSQTADVTADAQFARFRVKLGPGPTQLKTTFLDAEGQSLLGAYYAYVRRLPASGSPQ
jgi:arylsulfatase A-like enzyme